MKVLVCNDCPISAKVVKTIYIGTIKNMLLKHHLKRDLATIQLFDTFSQELVFEALDRAYVVQNRIYIPTQGEYGKILRYLEYGGQGVRATKLLSIVARTLNKKIGGDINVL